MMSGRSNHLFFTSDEKKMWIAYEGANGRKREKKKETNYVICFFVLFVVNATVERVFRINSVIFFLE
jgi:hypothetical protein